MINSFPGNVYITPDRNDGIFLNPQACTLIKSVTDAIISEPSVAGPPLDIAVLRELSRVIGESRIPASEDGPPVVLSHEQSIYLELIIGQLLISETVSLKIRITCGVCDAPPG